MITSVLSGCSSHAKNVQHAAININDNFSPSTVNKMVNFVLAHQVLFPAYIPVGGLGAKDYSIKSMTSQPSFTLFSNIKSAWMIISEYSSTTDEPIKSLSWTPDKIKTTGMKYWIHHVAKNITDYYFIKGSTVIMVQNNAKGSPAFPTHLVNFLKPLYTFTSSN